MCHIDIIAAVARLNAQADELEVNGERERAQQKRALAAQILISRRTPR